MIIKVCGMTDSGNIKDVAALGIDWIGMVFCPESPRYVGMTPSYAGIIPDKGTIDAGVTNVKNVGVFADATSQEIITRIVNFKLDIIQLNGNESPVMIDNLRNTIVPDINPDIKIIKAIRISRPEDIESHRAYEAHADYLLFDTKRSTKGGSDRQFDWSALDTYDGRTPFLLGGGIGPDDAERIKNLRNPKMAGIDINSRFETSPGIKDMAMLSKFICNIRQE